MLVLASHYTITRWSVLCVLCCAECWSQHPAYLERHGLLLPAFSLHKSQLRSPLAYSLPVKLQ